MTRTQPRIAVLDDEAQMLKALRRLLRTHGFIVEIYTSGNELLKAFAHQTADCLLLDLHMPEMTGFQVMEALTAREMRMPVIIITGHDEPKNAERVLSLGAAAYLTKPIDEVTLLTALRKAIPATPGFIWNP